MKDPISIPVLKTVRLQLEPLSMQHSEGMFKLWSDPAVCEFSGVVTDYDQNVIPMPASSQSESDRVIDFWLKAAKDGWGFRWAVIDKETNSFTGTIGFNSVTACAEIAFHLIRDYWGQGIMSEAGKAAIDWCGQSGRTEIEAFIEPDNKGSIALSERLGLTATDVFSEGAQRYMRVLC